ncbi:AAA family ATPase [Streptosporangiaceae bacterium NEAU-GS5]|nr:AAA family ATPase [Streptosporangiaceae bacterium NEAU-GS5]
MPPGSAGVDDLTSPLVGRGAVVAAFDRALESARGGTFQSIAVSGDPGVGKTRLLAELSARAKRLGFVTLWGRAAELEMVLPFDAFIDALDDHLDSRDDLAGKLTEAQARLLAGVFPALGDLSREPAAEDPAEGFEDISGLARYRLHRAVRALLRVLAEPHAGLLLILDDAHWADDATVDLIDHLWRHHPDGAVLVALAYRSAQVPARLAAVVAGDEIPIRPLSKEESDAFLGDRVQSQSRRAELYDKSGGNPFYLDALARMGENAELPLTVRAALKVELGSLSPEALLVAQAAATTAIDFDPALVAVAGQVEEAEVIKALDELTARDIVRKAGPRFNFRHPLVRQAAYESAAAGWLHAAHARIAAKLAEMKAPATTQAHHVERSAAFGDRAAIGVLVEAAKAVGTNAPTTSAHWLKAALDLLPEEPDVSTRTGLLLDLARHQTLGGQLEEGRDTAYELLELLPHDDHGSRALAARFCALIERLLDRPGQGRNVLLAELRQLPDPVLPVALPLRLRLVAESLMRGDPRAAQAVLDFMPETDDVGLGAAIAALRPMAAYALYNVADARDHLVEARRMVEGATDLEMLAWMDTIAWLCWAEMWLGEHSSALHRFEWAVARTRATGQTFIVTTLLAGLARAYREVGRLAEAEVAAEESAEVARLLKSGYARVISSSQQSLVATATGDLDTAVRLAGKAVNSGASSTEWPGAQARFAYATALAAAGRQAELAQVLTLVEDDIATWRLDQFSYLSLCVTMAIAEGTRHWADRADEMVHPEVPFNAGLARLARAHVVEGPAAAEAALEAYEILAAAGLRLDAGRAMLRAAMCGDRSEALARLQAAHTIFEECGAHGLLELTIQQERRHGSRVTTAARGRGLHGLTARELEIARLVATGLTNQKIADRLHVSVRTIETHLSRAFEKLGVNTRTGLVNALNQLGM